MATNDKGSDLDIFEGLSKKGGSGAPTGGVSSGPPPPPPRSDGQHTLMGLTAPSSTPIAPPPPGSGLLPPTTSRPPPPPPGRTALAPVGPTSPLHLPAAKPSVDVSWDDEEDEATQIFDKADDLAPNRIRSAPLPAAGAPPPPMSMKSTLVGLTPPPSSFLQSSIATLPPPSGHFSATPSPPGGLPPPAFATLPPPPSTLQGLGSALRALPPPPGQGPGSSPPFMGATIPGTTMPPARSGVSSRPVVGSSLPPRSMEATALLRPTESSALRWAVLSLIAVAVVVGVVLYLMPHNGRIVINVTDPKGAPAGRVDIFVDGRLQCATAPCTVEQSAGIHDVKILADGFDVPSPQSVNVEGHKDSMATFVIAPASKGTGIHVNGTQPGVKLYVDDKEIGPLPQDYREMTPGDHVVKIVGSERYQPIERRVTLDKDKIEDLGAVTLKVLKGKATVSLSTPGARVFLISGIDRRELPMLPISVDIDTTKNWALQASRPGFIDYNQPISFDDGQAEKTYVVALEPKTGSQVGSTWAPAAPQSQTPAPPAYTPPPAPRPAPVSAQVAQAPVAQAQAASQAASGGGGEAFLNINSIPPSTCFVDGKPLGPTPKVHISVSPGAHQVKFVNAEQGLTKTMSVSVRAGEVGYAVTKLAN
jgi:PEGA domain